MMRCTAFGHVWLRLAVWNLDATNDFGPEGEWDGAYTRYCLSCHKFEIETHGNPFNENVLIAMVNPINDDPIGIWLDPGPFQNIMRNWQT